MNITRFIEYLNKSRGWNLQPRYYSVIEEWKQWWKGLYPPFHLVRECLLDGTESKRTMASLRMPKRACEDWANLLLNDKTTATIADAASSAWLLGRDGSQTGGELGRLQFWPNANRLVELAFRSGTGAFVLSVTGLAVQGGAVQATPGALLHLDYLPAECILPITVCHGRIIEAAFASEVIEGGRNCIYLQTHRLQGGQYRIYNDYFTGTGEGSAAYKPAPRPEGVPAAFHTGSDSPWFAVFSPAACKNIDGGLGLGMAVFSEALDQARLCDLAFDNYCRDLYLGGKKVFYNKSMLRTVPGLDGSTHHIAPDLLRQQLFVQVDGTDPDDRPDWHEYNPDLRVEANGRAVQDALDYFSFKCGLGCHRYRFEDSGVKTATEYIGSRQDMVQQANRHQIGIEAALRQLFASMLEVGSRLLGAPVDPATEITINFDDSYITDDDTRRALWRDDALQGFLPKYRYLMEWYGMSEQDARHTVAEAQAEADAAQPFGFGGAGNA